MIETRISPTGNLDEWEIMTRADYKTIGHIRQGKQTFTIVPAQGLILSGVNTGPHLSKEDAVSAIEAHTGGPCRPLGVGRAH